MKLILSVLFTALTFLSAQAQILSTSQSLPFSISGLTGSGTATFSFTPFDTSLGTLVSETLTLSGTSADSQTVRSAGNYAEKINVPFKLKNGSGAQIDGETISQTVSGTAPYGGYAISPSTTFSYGPYTSVTGTSFSFVTSNGVLTNTTNNFSNSYTTSGDLTITYNYQAAPEPSTWALMLGGAGALFFVTRRRLRA